MNRSRTKNQELWLWQAIAVVSPRNANKAQIGAIIRYRFDLNMMPDWEHAGEFITNDVFKNPTSQKLEVSHVQPISLQTLNDIITVSNQTKIKYGTGQKLLDPYTEEQVLQYAHANQPLVTSDDAAFFVGNLNRVKQG